MATQDSFLLLARYLVTGVPQAPVLEHHAIRVINGRIDAILPQSQLDNEAQLPRVELGAHLVFPGLINSHTHLSMNLLRGVGNDQPLMPWLHEHIWPLEQRYVGPEFVRDGLRAALAESLRAGVTCFNDMYFFPEDFADVCKEVGIRATIGLPMFDFPTAYGSGPEDYFAKGARMRERLQGETMLQAAWAPHAPYTVSEPHLREIVRQRDASGLRIQMHVHETEDEIRQHLDKHGKRPLAHLQEIGLLDPHLMAVHMANLNDDDIEQVVASGCHVVHCPESNMKLASGFCPTQQLVERGVNIAIGTDGVASNNDLDLLGEARTASFIAKGSNRDATAINAGTAFAMATINGARALGWEDHIGTLEVGKAADMVAMALDNVDSLPLYDAVGHLIYSSSREHIRHVWVAGRQLLADRQLTSIDESACIGNLLDWQEKMQQVLDEQQH